MSVALVTGACGFIGFHLTQRLLREGYEVIGYDNLSRRGVEANLQSLQTKRNFSFVKGDVASEEMVARAVASTQDLAAVFHLAGQVTVTRSYEDPVKDFHDNAVGSFNVISAIYKHAPQAYALMASTNKVYGHLTVDRPVSIDALADPYTPYGVSKLVGDYYFREYGRSEFGLDTCVLRQSCIYGTHQYGFEEQGWLAWFAIANILDFPVTIFGSGAQVRDLLFAEDLVDLYIRCLSNRTKCVAPVGGGPDNSISISEGLALIAQHTGKEFSYIRYEGERPGDQPYFVANLEWANKPTLYWYPKIGVAEGLAIMVDWVRSHKGDIEKLHR